jgi:hypothetical protein
MRITTMGGVLVIAFAASNGSPLQGHDFFAPMEGTLYVSCIGGTAGAESQFGTGTSPENFRPLLRELPSTCPSPEVAIGHVGEGERIVFGVRTLWDGRVEWAFSNRNDRPSTIAFGDSHNLLGLGGDVIQTLRPNLWVMHLDDAASYLVDDDNDDVLIQLRFEGDRSALGTNGPPGR